LERIDVIVWVGTIGVKTSLDKLSRLVELLNSLDAIGFTQITIFGSATNLHDQLNGLGLRALGSIKSAFWKKAHRPRRHLTVIVK
jgi:hypothetical protein